ncbi:MAG: hypothetical protein AAF518_11615 [Spirochaetota bacterium]
MLLPMVFLISLFVFLLLVLYFRTKKFEASLAPLNEKIAFLENELKTEKLRWDADHLREPEMFVTISIPDPLELAKQRSSLAKYVGHMMPLTLKRKVYEEVMKETIVELERQGVVGEVRVRYL